MFVMFARQLLIWIETMKESDGFMRVRPLKYRLVFAAVAAIALAALVVGWLAISHGAGNLKHRTAKIEIQQPTPPNSPNANSLGEIQGPASVPAISRGRGRLADLWVSSPETLFRAFLDGTQNTASDQQQYLALKIGEICLESLRQFPAPIVDSNQGHGQIASERAKAQLMTRCKDFYGISMVELSAKVMTLRQAVEGGDSQFASDFATIRRTDDSIELQNRRKVELRELFELHGLESSVWASPAIYDHLIVNRPPGLMSVSGANNWERHAHLASLIVVCQVGESCSEASLLTLSACGNLGLCGSTLGDALLSRATVEERLAAEELAQKIGQGILSKDYELLGLNLSGAARLNSAPRHQ